MSGQTLTNLLQKTLLDREPFNLSPQNTEDTNLKKGKSLFITLIGYDLFCKIIVTMTNMFVVSVIEQKYEW